ncbi:ribonucleotide reductase large subunit [Earliella scabrosa]|nr:ribonucleotide reductase large subunit [Earliella scabrosa]
MRQSPELHGFVAACARHHADRPIELPQFVYMRMALTIHRNDLPMIIETYRALSRRDILYPAKVMHAAATTDGIYPSTFIYQPSQPASRLYSSTSELDDIWSNGGAAGISLSGVPARRQPTKEAGVMSVLQGYDAHAGYHATRFDRRTPIGTAYLPVWHAEVENFIQCKTEDAVAGERILHLATVVSLPDIFMERVDSRRPWSLFDPVDVPDLQTTYGDRFSAAYTAYESQGIAVSEVQAEELWYSVCDAQRRSKYPLCVFHCALNEKNTQAHLGVIHAANDTTGLVQHASTSETPATIPATVALQNFVDSNGIYDFAKLHRAVKLAVYGCDRLIEETTYTSHNCITTVLRTRGLSINTVGLADAFIASRFRYGDANSRLLNVDIFATVYHAALDASCDLAQKHGPYPSWTGSCARLGILHMDMWPAFPEARFDFDALRLRIARFGLRNSVVTAQSCDISSDYVGQHTVGAGPQHSNVIVYRDGEKEYTEVRPSLVRELTNLGMWNAVTRTSIEWTGGSVLHLPDLPNEVMDIYYTAREINPVIALDMAAERAPYIEQAESMSIDMPGATVRTLHILQCRAWDAGMKTAVYRP